MFLDVGGWEFLFIAVVAVLLLGPDRLPKMVAEGVRWLRVLREQANRARSDLSSAAQFDPSFTEDLRQTFADISELHPKRIATSFVSDVVTGTPTPNGSGGTAPGVNAANGQNPPAAGGSDAPTARPAPAPGIDPDAT